MARKRSTSRSSRSSRRNTSKRKNGALLWLTDRLGLMRDAIAERMNRSTLRRATIASGWLMLVGAVLFGWIVGIPALEQRLVATHITSAAHDADTTLSQHRYLLQTGSTTTAHIAAPSRDVPAVHFSHRPAWMGDALYNMLVRTAQDHLTRDPLARHELINVRAALLETGCFADVSQVVREAVNRVRIDATFLEPFAILEPPTASATRMLIDPAGRLLPPTYQPGEGSKFIRIRNVYFEPPAQPGQVWPGEDIIAAIELIRKIERRPWRTQVEAIDMRGYMHGSPIQLITTTHATRITWGSRPGFEEPGEVNADEKLRRLDWMYTQWSRIDGNEKGELDITQPHPAVIHRR